MFRLASHTDGMTKYPDLSRIHPSVLDPKHNFFYHVDAGLLIHITERTNSLFQSTHRHVVFAAAKVGDPG